MTENVFETQYDVTKKSKIRRFYESNKILIFSTLFIFIILIIVTSIYFTNKEKKIILLSEDYVKAKIYLQEGNKSKAKEILKRIAFSNDPTYSTLSLFLLLDQSLLNDNKELISMFDHLLKNNKYEKEMKNLLIYKKVLLSSNFLGESEILKEIKPILNSESVWKPHALLFLGNYFFEKKEYLKAKEFYEKILMIKNLPQNFYNEATSQLILISNA